MSYKLTMKGELLASGDFKHCWAALLEHAGDQTLAEVETAGYKIETAE